MQIDNLGVIGAGMMGAEIALIFAMSGKSVMLNDTSQDRLDEALNKLSATLDAGISRNFWTEEDKAITLSNIALTTNLEDFSECHMVIEAVFEDAAVKGEVFKKLDNILNPIASLLQTLRVFLSLSFLQMYLRLAKELCGAPLLFPCT